MWAAKQVLNENPRSFLRGSLSCCEPSHAGTAGSRSIGIVLAEAVVFFLPAWAPTLPIGRQVLAWALFLFISVFALTNTVWQASRRRIRRRPGLTGRLKALGRPTMRSMLPAPSGMKLVVVGSARLWHARFGRQRSPS
jgi:hypothetical protein